MRCCDFEQLIDAYLDGELSGTLRIEFDAHRLGCHHCQQGVAMMEALGGVVAHDSGVPPLSPGFTERVLAELGRATPVQRRGTRRLWFSAVGGLSAAALLGFAWLGGFFSASGTRLEPHGAESAGSTTVVRVSPPAELAFARLAAPRADSAPDREDGRPDDDARAEAIRAVVLEKLSDRVWDAYAGGAALSGEFVQLANYLNINLPDDLARDSIHLSSINPLMGLLQAIVPSAAAEEADAPSGDDVYIL